ncbi:MAG: NAD(P)-dependent glycerol-3-phosphate dehydrogenase [SAR324 cluster bacterium]|nr:NAD(P)-dependent glycerol-3-phosphate dehydrogenase [SAR324 cluster bacterium]MCZ6557883.1 NAD(P)-dependent glycerol-3-phosphate dehydrogenase [SAR324 cluster bacterium]MCZ6627217.1 NAD(P)-dependent glycerol-3-phosphate dehydrogenase [SAR324 cluster bacterium]MCZ6646763.1 NAD(P)-dependent glycerol-3-phosphate dehydrogenase [SAR324 cluster bacterium]MCZ6730395.1 NAD(P)-dependent glycerol-3-phosphate dehydrogenase [SAR324 cluster bacterium]
MKVAVLAAGTWGITLATLLTRKGLEVAVWEYAEDVVEELLRTRRHPKLPHLEIPSSLAISTDLAATLAGCTTIVCVVPAAHVRQTCRRIAEIGYSGQTFTICSKGIEQGSHALMSEVVEAELGAGSSEHIGVLSGPSHAEEVSREIPTAVTSAAAKIEVAEEIRELFMTPRFRIYTQTDVVGVELAAALKNVIAIACGISDGLGFGDNSKAGLVTRGMSEIMRVGLRMGARQETFFGLAGIGDLVVTCMSHHSRNWKFGYLIGQGKSPEQALDEVGMVVEGYYSVQAAIELAAAHNTDMPITEAVSAVLFKGSSPGEAVTALMMREPKSEMHN